MSYRPPSPPHVFGLPPMTPTTLITTHCWVATTATTAPQLHSRPQFDPHGHQTAPEMAVPPRKDPHPPLFQPPPNDPSPFPTPDPHPLPSTHTHHFKLPTTTTTTPPTPRMTAICPPRPPNDPQNGHPSPPQDPPRTPPGTPSPQPTRRRFTAALYSRLSPHPGVGEASNPEPHRRRWDKGRKKGGWDKRRGGIWGGGGGEVGGGPQGGLFLRGGG